MTYESRSHYCQRTGHDRNARHSPAFCPQMLPDTYEPGHIEPSVPETLNHKKDAQEPHGKTVVFLQ